MRSYMHLLNPMKKVQGSCVQETPVSHKSCCSRKTAKTSLLNKKSILKNLTKFRGKHLCGSLHFNRPGSKAFNRLLHRCFLVNFAKYFRTGDCFWNFKGTVMQIEEAMTNDRLRVSKVSWKFHISTFYNFAVIYQWNLLFPLKETFFLTVSTFFSTSIQIFTAQLKNYNSCECEDSSVCYLF